jgi:adenosylmethionine-8-amino-7-oxononanoate aminotransferase
VCERHGVLLILDEVVCGMGRIGHLFAQEIGDIVPDTLCIANSLGADVSPLGRCCVNGSVLGENQHRDALQPEFPRRTQVIHAKRVITL